MTSVLPLSQAQGLPGVKKAKRHKYNAKPVIVDGRRFDSTLEGKFYASLKLRERAGEVQGLACQREYKIIVNGKHVRSYFADFTFWDTREDRFRVIDVKGKDTPLSKFKRDLVEAIYGVRIEIVGKGGA